MPHDQAIMLIHLEGRLLREVNISECDLSSYRNSRASMGGRTPDPSNRCSPQLRNDGGMPLPTQPHNATAGPSGLHQQTQHPTQHPMSSEGLGGLGMGRLSASPGSSRHSSPGNDSAPPPPHGLTHAKVGHRSPRASTLRPSTLRSPTFQPPAPQGPHAAPA